MKLRRKILLAIILLVFIPVIAMGSVTYYTYSQAMEKKSSHFYWISLQETDRRLKFALNEITTISNFAITQQAVQQALKQPESAVTYNRRQEMNNLIHHPMILSFALYSHDRLIYSDSDAYTLAELQAQEWYGRVVEAQGRPVWAGPGEDRAAGALISDQAPSTGRIEIASGALIQARTIKDYHSLEDIGTLIIYVKPDLLDQVFWEAATLKQGDILLVNQEGRIVFDKSGERIGEHAAFPFLEAGYSNGKGYYVDDDLGESSLITYLPSHHKEWFLVAVTEKKLIASESSYIRNLALLLGGSSLLSAFLFDRFFVRRLVQSIIGAVNGMKQVKRGSFVPIPSPGRADDETDLLIDGFNRMSAQIEELLQQIQTEQARKKEAEMQALVAQINPHFIYNSLESINSMAVLEGNRNISKMVISLGKLLRISINENQELIPLSMELEHVRHYMNIQKFRFEDQFDYEITIPEELKFVVTQKLIVQPIVENALYHAIEPMEEPGLIRIAVSDAGDEVFIDITDNGPGFSKERLQKLYGEEQGPARKYRENGVGLKNVHERLQIRFGGRYGMMICSAPGFGSTIRIRIPKMLP
ncbi:sensor histidine kinase [Paenibacillus sp. JSM ZJ436]|uniref:sensor histidine kinase n=1 Tax=Paenibacillus sp. JSM ZJ436 TaxID=3376190 RepID=UPI0037BBB77B